MISCILRNSGFFFGHLNLLCYYQYCRGGQCTATPSPNSYGSVLMLRFINEYKVLARFWRWRHRFVARYGAFLTSGATARTNNFVLARSRRLFARGESFLTHNGYSFINGPTYPCCSVQPAFTAASALGCRKLILVKGSGVTIQIVTQYTDMQHPIGHNLRNTHGYLRKAR